VRGIRILFAGKTYSRGRRALEFHCRPLIFGSWYVSCFLFRHECRVNRC
jgi:hypothetical protein